MANPVGRHFCEARFTDGLGVVAGAEEELGRAVPEGDDDGVEVGQRLQRRVEEAGEAHVGDLDAAALRALAHHQNVGRFLFHTVEAETRHHPPAHQRCRCPWIESTLFQNNRYIC